MTLAKSPGARRWSARSTTAISAAAALCLAFPAPTARAQGTIERLLATVAAYAPADAGLPESSTLRRLCGADALCAARLLARALGKGAALERVAHPDTDIIRRATTPPSVRALGRLPDGAALIALDRFGRTAERELREAIAALDASRVVLDLRANRGGGFERMLRVAGLFTGPVAHALDVIGKDGRRPRAIPLSDRIAGVRGLTVVVGRHTASSGEMLAALLRRHAGAEIVGEKTAGKDYLVRVVPVHHDWRLVLPAERVEIAGESLAGGLRPDRPAPELAPR
jgi:hypothetical protein